MKSIIILLALVFLVNGQSNETRPTITTASGTHAPPRGSFQSGDLIFEEVFEELDFERWQHENTLAGKSLCKKYSKFELNDIFSQAVETGSSSGTRTTDLTRSRKMAFCTSSQP